MSHYPEPVEDYTDAFLTTAGGILFMSLWILAALAGYLWVAVVVYGLNKGISLLSRR